MKKTKQLILRWSLVTGGLIALFWAIWYLITGEVPVVTSIKISSNWTYVLPFGVSRWWDILIGPIWSTIIILLLTSKKLKGDEDRIFGLVVGLGVGLIVSLGAGLGVGLIFSLGAGLIVGLVVGLIALIKVVSVNFWTKVWNWLLVK